MGWWRVKKVVRDGWWKVWKEGDGLVEGEESGRWLMEGV